MTYRSIHQLLGCFVLIVLFACSESDSGGNNSEADASTEADSTSGAGGVGGAGVEGGVGGAGAEGGAGGAGGVGGAGAGGGAGGVGGAGAAGGVGGVGGAGGAGAEGGAGGVGGAGGAGGAGGVGGVGGAGGAGGGGAGGVGGAGGPVEQPDPDGPQACVGGQMGACPCSNEAGFTTYQWTVDGQSRCFTIYTPDRNEPMPVYIKMNCYARNQLAQGGCTSRSGLIDAANRYGFVAVCASSTDGNWTFGNDGVSNDQNPTPCADEDSKDIPYLRGILDTIGRLADQGIVDRTRVFTGGFSQNSMFAAYAGICFSDEIAGVWQGGSGLFVAGETDPLPQMEGACRRSAFLEHGQDCRRVAPCDECQYFPAYPVSTDPARRVCVMAYEDDSLFPTARPMYTRLVREGHHATLLSFPDVGRGHSEALQDMDWTVSCLGIVDQCSVRCEQNLVACMAAGVDENGDAGGGRDPGPHPCGDGVCDPVEQNNPRLCPRDCVNRPDGFDWCGDGLCDALERHRSSCPEDCGGGNGGGPGQNLEQLLDRYNECRAQIQGCAAGCAPTNDMLLTVEQPLIERIQP
ncbi:MAG: hypothetical protein VYA30_02555 [Myxococcota bacterium]|nr:hypothetical protein [Myxococcota bacterium]